MGQDWKKIADSDDSRGGSYAIAIALIEVARAIENLQFDHRAEATYIGDSIGDAIGESIEKGLHELAQAIEHMELK